MTVVSREKLYEEIWSEPAIVVAARYEVSSTFLCRVCEQLNIPTPPRGYWAKRKSGQKIKKPRLPSAKPGDDLEWARGSKPQKEPFPPGSKTKPPKQPNEKHPLIHGVLQHYEAARVSEVGYLKPTKRVIVDIFVSKETLTRALEISNQLFLALEDESHSVALSSSEQRFHRSEVDPREKPHGELSDKERWSPERPTVVTIGSVAIGLTLYERSEEVEARWVDGKYVRLSSLFPTTKRAHSAVLGNWTTKHDFPSGHLVLRAYSVRSVSWQKEWVESAGDELSDKIAEIIKELTQVSGTLAKQIEEHQQRQESERQQQQSEEQKKLYAQAVADSQEQLVSILNTWVLANNIEKFFEDLLRRADGLSEEEKAKIIARAEEAKKAFGGIDSLRYFRSWKSPEELVAEAEKVQPFWGLRRP
jgi:hypothetical protein